MILVTLFFELTGNESSIIFEEPYMISAFIGFDAFIMIYVTAGCWAKASMEESEKECEEIMRG